MPSFDFLIIGLTDHQDCEKLTNFLKGFGSEIFTCKNNTEAFQILSEKKIPNIIAFNLDDSAKHFIVEASVKKLMKDHTFYFASDIELPQNDKIKLMTLGFYGFIKFPFNANEIQNTLDFSDLGNIAA